MSGRRRLRDGLRPCLAVFVAARIGLSVLSMIAIGPIDPLPPVDVPGRAAPPATPGWHNAVDATVRQDAVWYLRLADRGWSPNDASAAFFPVYPVTVRVADAVLPGSTVLAAMVVSNLAFLGALLALFAFTAEAFGERVARRGIVVAAVFPTAFFLLAPYTESLFLLLSVLAFREARHDRWGRVAVFGGLAAVTRSVGILLVPALAIEAFLGSRNGRLRRLAGTAAIALGPLLWVVWWGLVHGNALAPFDAQALWGRVIKPPWASLWRTIELAWTYGSYWLLDLLVVGVAVAGLALAMPALRRSEAAYGVLSLALPLFDPYWDRPLLSAPRFAAVVFPALWGLSGVGLGRRLPAVPVAAVLAAGYAVCAVLFVNWLHLF